MKKKIVKRRTNIERPFGDGNISNAAFFGMLRAALRNKSRFFPSVANCKERVKEPYIGTIKRRKWSYRCEDCHKLFDSKSIFVHHKIECGELNSFDDLPGFVKRLFCDSKDLTAICDLCHSKKHNNLKPTK